MGKKRKGDENTSWVGEYNWTSEMKDVYENKVKPYEAKARSSTQAYSKATAPDKEPPTQLETLSSLSRQKAVALNKEGIARTEFSQKYGSIAYEWAGDKKRHEERIGKVRIDEGKARDQHSDYEAGKEKGAASLGAIAWDAYTAAKNNGVEQKFYKTSSEYVKAYYTGVTYDYDDPPESSKKSKKRTE